MVTAIISEAATPNPSDQRRVAPVRTWRMAPGGAIADRAVGGETVTGWTGVAWALEVSTAARAAARMRASSDGPGWCGPGPRARASARARSSVLNGSRGVFMR
jgi:hypothetical protein